MKILRFALSLAPGLAVLLAMGTAAEPTPQLVPQALAPAEGEALDASPAPGSAEAAPPQQVQPSGELPAAARSAVWRAGARPPGDVPPSVVVRTAMRKGSVAASAPRSGAPETEGPRAIEIVWNAPGS